MVEAVIEKNGAETAEEAAVSRIYEVGYHLVPTIKEEDLDKVVGGVRSIIEKAGGSFIAEGAPALTRLAYPLHVMEKGKRVEYDRGFFGWLKFESTTDTVDALNEALKRSADVMRSMVFETVRDDTRAKIKAPRLAEVKRTESIKTTPRHEESSAPVSEEQLDKALEDLTSDK